MREFFRTMVHHLEAGEPVILVSLLSSSGSTPRGAGAMMACFPGGSAGTIGGGNVEFTAQNLAKELLVSRENALRSYRFTPGDAASLGMVCGGDITVHFQYLDPADTAAVAALRRLVELSGGGQGLWLLRRLAGERVTETRVLTEGEAPELAAYLKDATLFQDGILTIPVSRPGTVWLFGGGHVSQALAAVLAPLDFRVAVYDDRPEFTGEDRFPLAVQRVAEDFFLPSPTGSGVPLSRRELEEKLEQLHPSVFFSHELCARYFTYMSRESGAHFVLFDDRDTLRKKLEVAQELGITSAVAALPEVLDAAGELGIRN